MDKRLTVNDLNKVCYDPWELCGMDKFCTKGAHSEGGCTKGCFIVKMYKKLAEYENLEYNGLLKRLPCKEGTTVYKIHAYDCGNTPCLGYCTDCRDANWKVVPMAFTTDCISELNKTIFLSEEQAYDVLNVLKSKNK